MCDSHEKNSELSEEMRAIGNLTLTFDTLKQVVNAFNTVADNVEDHGASGAIAASAYRSCAKLLHQMMEARFLEARGHGKPNITDEMEAKVREMRRSCLEGETE